MVTFPTEICFGLVLEKECHVTQISLGLNV